MIRLYQALNYLQTGKSGPARAEIFKIRQGSMIPSKFGEWNWNQQKSNEGKFS